MNTCSLLQKLMTVPAADDSVTELADLFRLLGDPTRLRIVLACLEGPVAVHDKVRRHELSRSLVSHHLRLLRAARIVKADRQRKPVFYVAADQHIAKARADGEH